MPLHSIDVDSYHDAVPVYLVEDLIMFLWLAYICLFICMYWIKGMEFVVVFIGEQNWLIREMLATLLVQLQATFGPLVV